MRKDFSEYININKCSIIKKIVSKKESDLISKSIFNYAKNFFAVIDQLQQKGIKDKLLHDKINLEEFVYNGLSQESIKAILSHKDNLTSDQLLYFEGVSKLSIEHFQSFYVEPMQSAYKEYGYLY